MSSNCSFAPNGPILSEIHPKSSRDVSRVFDVNPRMDRLGTMCPAGFNRSDVKALPIGIGPARLARVGVHPALMEVSRVPLRRALKVDTNSPADRRALAKGGFRDDRQGQPAGEVTPEP